MGKKIACREMKENTNTSGTESEIKKPKTLIKVIVNPKGT